MKNRKKKINYKGKNSPLIKDVNNTFFIEKNNPSGKLNLKIFPSSKYTPSYVHVKSNIPKYLESGLVSTASQQGDENNQPEAEKKTLESWQKLLSQADLSVRATNVLIKNFFSSKEFLACNDSSFCELKNCGRKTVNEITKFRDSIIAANGENLRSDNIPTNPPFLAEDLLRLPPTEETLLLLPVFSSKLLDNFAASNLHPGFKGGTHLADFVLSVRTSKILRNLGLATIGEVMVLPYSNLLDQKNFGRKCLKEVQNIINSFVLRGDMTPCTSGSKVVSGKKHSIDCSSYENLITNFVRHCLKTKRNQEIISSRFNFPNRLPTLELIGSQFGLTRERVRQILKRGNTLLRVKAHRDLLAEFWQKVVELISGGGGIIGISDLTWSLQKEYNWPDAPNPLALKELLEVGKADKKFTVSGEVITVPCPCLTCKTPMDQFLGLDFESNYSYHLLVVADKLVQQCREQCQLIPIKKFHKAFIERLVSDFNGTYRIHDDLIFPQERWLAKHGERLEDIIVQVLENHGQPMHFTEIAAAIRKKNLKHQEISAHNVHAAMMRFDSIEIVQRGTYGLKAWDVGGYRSVSTAIDELLKANDLPMRRSEIIKRLTPEFSEQNISAALHNWSSRFVSIGEGFYDLPEKWRKRSVHGLIDRLPDALADFARFITTNNNCSYKLVLALVFIRGMDEKGAFYLPTLKERFFNFYLGRHKKGELVETENVLMHRIGELDANEIKNKSTKEPLKSFLHSNFWSQKYSSLYLHGILVELLANSAIHNLLLIIFLKGIDEYFTPITPPSSNYPMTGMSPTIKTGEDFSCFPDESTEELMDSSSEYTLSITIKKKSRGKISL